VPIDEGERPTRGQHSPPAVLQEGDSRAIERPGRLLTSLHGAFSSTYLTLTSIIQGVALAYLITVADDEMSAFGTASWLLVATVFLAIVAAWHEYMTAVTVFVWIPRLRDSLIPFLLGGSEIVLIRSLRREDDLELSFLALGVVALVTLSAFINMYVSAAKAGEINRSLLIGIAFYRPLNLAFVGFSCVLFFLFSALEARTDSSSLDVGLSAAALALVVAFLARGSLYWSRIIRLAERDAAGGAAVASRSSGRHAVRR
jgi:hypothetical protein